MKSIKQQTTDNLNINWKNFYRSVFALVIPMALQNLINVGVTAADVIMLGKVGEKVLSGASLAGQIQFRTWQSCHIHIVRASFCINKYCSRKSRCKS